MSEERMKILSMLQEGKITAQEAERLLEALAESSRAEGSEYRRKPRPRDFWDADFDFNEFFDPRFRKFGPFFDEEFKRKFRDRMHDFKRNMRWGDEEARREAREKMREAAEGIKEALEKSHIKDTVEEIGKAVLDAMEQVVGSLGGQKRTRDGEPSPGQEPPKGDTASGTGGTQEA